MDSTPVQPTQPTSPKDPAAKSRATKKQLQAAPLKTPFRRIAMALSGGGFRASSFSIGAMSYLHRVEYTDDGGFKRNLLDNVEFISSASGGTFPGILYSSYAKKGWPFEAVYQDIIEFMEGETLLEDVLALLNEDKEWEGEAKTRNFINAFAKIYDQKLFKGEVFGVYWGAGIEAAGQRGGGPALQGGDGIGQVGGAGGVQAGATGAGGVGKESKDGGRPVGDAGAGGAAAVGRNIEVCFNATEFYRGLSFRWQTDGRAFVGHRSDEGKTGNQYIYFDKEANREAFETLQRVKLGDIMASSSCFPAGFEPIVYPRDFSYRAKDDRRDGKGLSSELLQQSMVITDYNDEPRMLDCSIGLMDGGVDDNQGLYSAMLADQRRRKLDDGNGFDLVIVSDVASYFMDPYVPPEPVLSGSIRKKSIAELAGGLGGGLQKLNKALKIIGCVSGVLLLAALLLLVFAGNLSLYNLGLLLLSPSILVLLIVAFVFGYQYGSPYFSRLSGLINSTDTGLLTTMKEELPALGVLSDKSLMSLGKFLKGAKIGVMEQMLKARVNSMMSMTLDINLKQTRRLIFDVFYGNFYGKDVWGNRRVFNVIYELSLFNIASREATIKDKFNIKQYPLPADKPDDHWADDCQKILLEGCMQLNAAAEQARTMGTTLWYDATDAASRRMRKVVACGQFTTCAKLLEYVLILDRILEREQELSFADRTVQFEAAALLVYGQVRAKLLDDWKRFKEDPFFLYDAMEKTQLATMEKTRPAKIQA